MARYCIFLLVACALLSSGCSMLIAGSGKDLATVTTREQVHAQFGEPVAKGFDEEGDFYEDFRTRRKIAEKFRGGYMGAAVVKSCGTLEFLLLPHELYLLGSRTFSGQTIRFSYDETGKVQMRKLDGDCLLSCQWWNPLPPEDAAPEKP